MTTDEQIARFNQVVQDRIDEIMLIEARVSERAKELKQAHRQLKLDSSAQIDAVKGEIAKIQEMLSTSNTQHDAIVQAMAKSKDFVTWSRRVLIYSASIALAVCAASSYMAHKNYGYVNDAQNEITSLEAKLAKTPVVYKDERGIDLVRVKTSSDDKVKWKTKGKHKGAYAEIEYAR